LRDRKNRKKFGRFSENNDLKVKISLSISTKLLAKIEKNISGDNRSQKVANCAEVGYLELTTPKPLMKQEISGVEKR